MASNMQSFPRILKMLRENSNIKDKRESLTYIRSNSKKLESIKAIKEEQYKELCKLVIDTFANGNNDVQNEAYETLNVIIRDFKDHSLNLFEAMSQISQKNRLKILKLLEVVDDNAISTFAYDVHAVTFFNNCMCTIQTNTMPWTAPTACVDNLQALIEAETKPLSDDQRLEEETINFSITLLRRLYKVAALTSDIKVQRFDALLLDKVMVLAYMGHKRQRGPALKLLQQALATDTVSHVRTKLVDAWSRYKAALQSTYCKRMLLLVSACELDWATQWNISIQFLGVDLHRGAGLINNLLSVEEKAFKSTETIIRRQAFLSWKLLVDNFALDPQELATARRIKLLCIPLNAKNSKNELIALTKLEVWWHVIIKLYKDISKFVNPVLTQFLNFCFGPLGDTPLLSSKFDIVAAPGKRFFKTKVVAVDALCQLLVTKQENHSVFSPILEERLPHSISDSVFQECYKSIIHSVGEALLVLSQLTDAEMKNRYQLGKILWTSLVNYIQESKMEEKEPMYKNMILVITELTNYAVDKLMIRDLILDIVLFEIADLSKNFNLQDDTLLGLMLKFLQIPILNEAQKNHYDAVKYICWQCIKSQKKDEYYPYAFKCLKEMYDKLCILSNVENKNETVIFELWRILAEVLTKYLDDLQEINEGNSTEHSLKTVESIVIFPFMYTTLEDKKQVQELLKVWKCLYKQFEMRADLISTVKPNEILLNVANAMQLCLVKNEKSYHLIIKCLDSLLSTVNYKALLAQVEVSPIMHLILKLITCSLSSKNSIECESALKALSAVLITIYGHNPQKVISYLQVSKAAVELILTSKTESLYKEVASTWETVVSILKGLNKLLDYDLISSYKTAILRALNHSNLDIQLQTVSLFEIQNVLSSNAKLVLEEIEKDASEITASLKSDIREKNDFIEKLPNQVKMVGSVLNKGSSSSKCSSKETEKSDKQIISDTDSQDYVLIKTDLKFDVDRLTEHQKESLKRRREDISALYNDLSSSQDTQTLQEWFDKRNKSSDDAERTQKKDSTSVKKIVNYDANKENEIEEEALEVTTKALNDMKSTENVKQNVSSDSRQSAESDTNSDENSPVENIRTTEKIDGNSLDSGTNEVDPNCCQEDFSESKNTDQRLSPSILDNGKRRNRSVARSSCSPKSDEIVSGQPGHSNSVQPLQRTLRPKVIQSHPKTVNKQKTSDNIEGAVLEEDKRGIKRKSVSDSESEGISQRRRRKSNLMESASDSDSCKSTESDNTAKHIEEMIEDGNLSQRTRNEISRLRINMVFDSPLSNSRRSKGCEDNKEPAARKQSPENKGTRLRVGDQKTGDYMKRIQKNSDKELNNASKKGKSSKIRIKTDRTNKANKIEEMKKISQNKSIESEEKKRLEDEKTGEETQTEVASKNISDIKCNLFGAKKSNNAEVEVSKDNISNNETKNKDTDLNKSISDDRDIQYDADEIIEDSQELSKLEKKCNEKQCFIKINKIGDLCNLTKLQEITDEDDEVANIVSNSCNNDDDEVLKDDINEFKETNEICAEKPKSTTPVNENSLFDNEKDILCEVEKINEGLLLKSVPGLSSPKSNIRRQLRFKPYSPQGRAAHMLGLVTKQARMESECHTINLDDDFVIRKPKTKDVDNETLVGKKERGHTSKEVDKVTASCSSRQEKIFNNMRSSDYCSSPPVKLFSNLKNDGEKIFSKIDKSVDCISVQTDAEAENVTEETLLDMDELPMLEWSSANPPSLTASPSASILKRHRQSIPEPDPESTTPNKRKRVSFADPPVSKEMGYEITNNDSPYKVNKYSPRGLLGRKDSPLRLKHVKQKLIRTDSEKIEKEEMDTADTSEIDVQCERENEMLTKIAEELEYSENIAIDTDTQTSYNFVENESIDTIPEKVNGCNKVNVDNLSGEVEITQDSAFVKHTESRYINKIEQNKTANGLETTKSSISLGGPGLDDFETQEDIFNGMNTKHDDNIEDTETKNDTDTSDVQKTSDQDNLLDSSKLSIINDSIRNHSFEKSMNSENLEDTVDTENLTGLNSTASSDEIFCGRLIRTSTQAAENMEEQDTLPVTDSVFESLPLSQDSQNASEFNAEIPHPELLDSTLPIYPALVSCSEPIKFITEQLTNPLWVQHLSTYFENRNLQTVGDLARLSEREVNRIPVKGNSKIEFMKNVLKWFEKTYTKETSNVTEASYSADVPASTTKIIFEDQSLSTFLETIQNESTNRGTSSIRLNSNKDDSVIANDKNASETTEDMIKSITHKSSNLSVSDVCSTSPRMSCQSATTNTASVSASLSKSMDSVTTNSKNLYVSSAQINPASESTIMDPNFSDANALSTVQSLKTVGTCTSTDTIYLSKTPVSKATKSVAAQMALEDLLDEIDVNLVLESAVRRCTPEKILLQYKNKMRHVPQAELERETIRMLGAENRKNCNEVTLKAACRAYGVNKVLLRLPDIFSADKQFFVKVLNAYRKKIKTSDCLDILDFTELKDAVFQKCTSSDLAEMLSRKLKEEEQEGIKKPMTELSSLDAMLKRMPMDVIISHTVANDELIPSRVVLDIALQNNSPTDVAQALESQSSLVTRNVFNKLWSSQFAIEHIEQYVTSKEDLLKIFKALSSKLDSQDFLHAFYESMNVKILVKEEED